MIDRIRIRVLVIFSIGIVVTCVFVEIEELGDVLFADESFFDPLLL